MPKMPMGNRGAVGAMQGRPKADFSALGRALKSLFRYYPRLAPLTAAYAEYTARYVPDSLKAANFEDIITIVSSVRSHLASLKTTNKPKIVFGNDPIVDDNQVLIQFLTKASSTIHSDSPKGLNLNVEGHRVYLDLPEKTIQEYKETLEQKILNLGKEIEILTRRLSNENYIKKAPASLIQETKDSVELKSQELQTMKTEYNQI